MTCDKCYQEIELGAWPFCPHGRGTNTVVGDDIPGGRVFENGFSEPTKFYSHSEHRKALADRGLEIRAKWAGPNDKHLTRWDSVDLEGAAALVTRGVQARAARNEDRRWPNASLPITVTDHGTVREKDLR